MTRRVLASVFTMALAVVLIARADDTAKKVRAETDKNIAAFKQLVDH